MRRKTIQPAGKKSPPQNEILYRSIIDSQTEFIIRFFPDGRLSFVNQAYCSYMGKEYDELVGQNFLLMLQENDREIMQALLSSLTLEEPVNTIKVRFMNPDGKTLWQQWTNRALFDDRGVLIAYQAVGYDINCRKEIWLPSSLYRTLFETAPVGLGIADMQGNLIAFNDAILKPGGYNRDDIAKIINVSALYYDLKEREKVLEIFRKQGFLHQHLVQFKRKDGTPYYTLLSLKPATYAGKACLQAMVEDVDQRKKLEDALVQSEGSYRNLFEYAPIALCELDLSALRRLLHRWKSEGIDLATYLGNSREALKECLAVIRITDANNAILKLFKANTKQEFIDNWTDTFQPDTHNTVIESILALARGKGRFEHESVARTFAGDTIRVFINWFVSLGCEETLTSIIVSVIDLTELRSKEKKLEQTEEQFAKLVATMNEGFGMQDKNGVITYVNEKLCRMFGYSGSELVGKHLTEFLDEPNRAVFREQMARRSTGSDQSYDLAWLRKNGGKVYTVVSPQPLYDQFGRYTGSFATLTDITGRKENEELILSYQKQLSLLASKLSLLEEKERRKTAADLHDNIGQILACAKIKLGELKESAGADLRDDLFQIQGLLDQSIMFTRSLTSELSVPVLYELGLVSAVEWIGKKYEKQHGLQFRLKDDGKVKPLDHDTKIILFKAIRESLTNVVKHANAHNVTVTMERKGHSIQVTVEDDGEGFDPSAIYGGPFTENRFGLFMLREAFINIGGSVNIASAPGSPTRITLTAPLAEE